MTNPTRTKFEVPRTIARFALATLTLGTLLAAVPGPASAIDRGVNQPGAAGNPKADPGVNQPGAAGNVKRDPGVNQPGAVGNTKVAPRATPGAGAPGPGVKPAAGAPGPGVEPANRGGPVDRPGRR
jgi:hypothetical protein